MRLRHVKAGDMVAAHPVKVVNPHRELRAFVSTTPGIITTIGGKYPTLAQDVASAARSHPDACRCPSCEDAYWAARIYG